MTNTMKLLIDPKNLATSTRSESTLHAPPLTNACCELSIVDTNKDAQVILTLFNKTQINELELSRYNRRLLGWSSDHQAVKIFIVHMGKEIKGVIEIAPSAAITLIDGLSKLKANKGSSPIEVEARLYSRELARRSAIKCAQMGGVERKVRLRLSTLVLPTA